MSASKPATTEPSPLLLDHGTREDLWRKLAQIIETHISSVSAQRVAPNVPPQQVRDLLRRFDFAQPMSPQKVLAFAVDGLQRFEVHPPHPRYFGLFNPAPTTMSIAADTLVAAFNPQLAVWGHSPFAVEVEQHSLRALGEKFGYDPALTDGTFTTCGSEANHSAILTALTNAFPEFARAGLRGLQAQPVFYVSAEGHHSLQKAARLCGLGNGAVREIPVGENLKMLPDALAARIQQDRREGFAPFLIVATAGTTNAGVIDPLSEIAGVAAEEKLWLHADAAWGGAAALVPELRPLLAGIERADSITFDAHKWISVPMGAGIYLTRHPEILGRTFHISAAYVPPKADGVLDPMAHSIQWSRRFIGLKIFLSLAAAGWEGYATTIRRMTAIGDFLRRELQASGWGIENSTPLPAICFSDQRRHAGKSREYLEAIAREVVASGEAWISTTVLRGSVPVLRACITNYRTGEEDIRALIVTLEKARNRMGKTAARA